MKLYFSIITAIVLLCANLAHADTWVYHATLPTQVKVYANMDSIRVTQARPEIRQVTVSLGRPGEETETLNVEVLCAPQGIRTTSQPNFSVTQPTQTMGKLVSRVCNK